MNQSNTLKCGITPKKGSYRPVRSAFGKVGGELDDLNTIVVGCVYSPAVRVISVVFVLESNVWPSHLTCKEVLWDVNNHLRVRACQDDSISAQFCEREKKNMAGEDDDNISDNRAWISKFECFPFHL